MKSLNMTRLQILFLPNTRIYKKEIKIFKLLFLSPSLRICIFHVKTLSQNPNQVASVQLVIFPFSMKLSHCFDRLLDFEELFFLLKSKEGNKTMFSLIRKCYTIKIDLFSSTPILIC